MFDRPERTPDLLADGQPLWGSLPPDEPPRDTPGRGAWGCVACWPAAAHDAVAGLQRCPEVAQLEERSHSRLSVCVCPACGQHYLRSFHEEIDWVHGDDPQRWRWSPLTPLEADALTGRIVDRGEGITGILATERYTVVRDVPLSDDERLYWLPPWTPMPDEADGAPHAVVIGAAHASDGNREAPITVLGFGPEGRRVAVRAADAFPIPAAPRLVFLVVDPSDASAVAAAIAAATAPCEPPCTRVALVLGRLSAVPPALAAALPTTIAVPAAEAQPLIQLLIDASMGAGRIGLDLEDLCTVLATGGLAVGTVRRATTATQRAVLVERTLRANGRAGGRRRSDDWTIAVLQEGRGADEAAHLMAFGQAVQDSPDRPVLVGFQIDALLGAGGVCGVIARATPPRRPAPQGTPARGSAAPPAR